MIMEYASQGELFDYVQSRGYLPQNTVRSIMRQLFSGKNQTESRPWQFDHFIAVEYMHASCIVHRDIKLENLLRMDDERIVITDFGFATSAASDQSLKTACGSPCYAAPELVLDKTVL